MSGAFSSKKGKSTTVENQQRDPWDEAIPYIRDFLRTDIAPMIGGSTAPTQGMTGAYDELRNIAQQGNPYQGQIDNLTNSLFGSSSYAPQAGAAYQDYQNRIGGIAGGANQNLGSSYLSSLMPTASGENQDIAGNPFAANWMAAAGGSNQDLSANPYLGSTLETAAGGNRDLSQNEYLANTARIASGANQDLNENPYLRQILDLSANAARTGIAEQFASAGRGFSPGHASATAKAITDAQLPTLANLFQYEQGRTDAANRDMFGAYQYEQGRTDAAGQRAQTAFLGEQARSDAAANNLYGALMGQQGRSDQAARDLYAAQTGQENRSDQAANSLYTAGIQTAGSQADLDRAAATLQQAGLDASTAALAARTYGPNMILAIEDQLRNLPTDQAAKLAAILFPAGQLGGQMDGTSNTKSKQSGFSLGFSL